MGRYAVSGAIRARARDLKTLKSICSRRGLCADTDVDGVLEQRAFRCALSTNSHYRTLAGGAAAPAEPETLTQATLAPLAGAACRGLAPPAGLCEDPTWSAFECLNRPEALAWLEVHLSAVASRVGVLVVRRTGAGPLFLGARIVGVALRTGVLSCAAFTP